MVNFETLCSNFRLTVVIPDLEFGELVWHRAVCLMPHVAVSSAAGPEDALRTILTQQLHVQSTWTASVCVWTDQQE